MTTEPANDTKARREVVPLPMPNLLCIRNRQRVRRVNTALLRRLTLDLLCTRLHTARFELCLHLVDAPEMARVNKQFLGHQGSTDVITFDHSALRELPPARGPEPALELHGEVYLCLRDAVAQAGSFRTSWQVELTRYVIHGLLHLCGYDDQTPDARRRMKRAENRLVRILAREFPVPDLALRPGRSRRKRSPAGL